MSRRTIALWRVVIAASCALTMVIGLDAQTQSQKRTSKGKQTARSRKAKAAARKPAPAPVVHWLALQVALDRAGFSPGEIDGLKGEMTGRALRAFQRAQQLPDTGEASPDTVAKLQQAWSGEALVRYTLQLEDLAGPFQPDLPAGLVEQSTLPSLGYRDAVEALGEKFHASPTFLQKRNPDARLEPGVEIEVPNVVAFELPKYSAKRKPEDRAPRLAALVEVVKDDGTLTARDESGEVMFYAPVTTGSEHDPLPPGDWKVTGVGIMPPFYYNPELFWDADPSHAKAVVPSGPNGPVGVVWIGIDREHYGLHGTAEPSKVGRTESHGCVRLTNWDALRLAAIVDEGTRVVFR